ncbi:endonuclease/exonuclease/phosphatase family protein [Microbacterium sp. JZ31]|uniref:endonuclease/exonuclease/phosphatase family protein n=1 Tax=Microbacterium sp. JZ31 TaxID=1906274 RepID=UPI001EE4B894|nr:endonuclease/exonuclease/phosphatase family protein [Microbacterium sp. JZ31]
MTSRNRTPLIFLATLLVGAPIALLFSWPQALGAQTAPLIAHALSFRALLAIGFGVSAAIAAAVALVRRRWGLAAGLALVLGAASLANGAVLLARGSSTSLPESELTVVTWNTYGTATAETIARLVRETGADVISLPETHAETAAEVARIVSLEGRAMNADTAHGATGYSEMPTSLLVADELGEYRMDAASGSTPALPSAVWVPVDGSGPTLVAAHPIPPLPGSIGDWRAGMEWIEERCADPEVILAGDLNATVDHLSAHLGACRDAATEAGGGAVGSWPSFAPSWMGSPIDHVLAGPAWDVRGAAVLTTFDDAGSDHRPVVAVLSRR